MSLGATMSAPASAWLAAVCASSFSDGSFRILWSAGHRPGVFRVFPIVPSRCPALRPDNAAMAVLHVFAQANVGDDQQRRQFLFQQPDGLLDDAVFRISAGSLARPFGRECRRARRPERRARGRGPLRAQFHPAKAGKRRAWRRWDGADFVRSARTAAAPVARRSNAFRPRAAATPAIAAAGAGDKRGIRANSCEQFSFCRCRAKVESEKASNYIFGKRLYQKLNQFPS